MIGLGEAATTTRYSSEFIKMVKQNATTTPYTPPQLTLTRHLGLERWGSHPLEGFRSIEQYHDVDDMMPPLFSSIWFCVGASCFDLESRYGLCCVGHEEAEGSGDRNLLAKIANSVWLPPASLGSLMRHLKPTPTEESYAQQKARRKAECQELSWSPLRGMKLQLKENTITNLESLQTKDQMVSRSENSLCR